jgi:SAM-dependent methyltransferase
VSEHGAWDAGAEAWVGLVRRDDPRGHPHDASILELLPPPAGRTLDVGCGEGRLTRELRARGYDAAGFDTSERLVAEARAADPAGSYAVAAADALPVEDGAAALVVCVNVLMHVEDLDAVLRELGRALVRGGSLLVGLVHPVAEAGRYDEEHDELRVTRYFEREPHGVPLGHVEVFHQHRTIEDYVRAFLGAGFALADLREVPGRTGTTPLYLDVLLERVAGA